VLAHGPRRKRERGHYTGGIRVEEKLKEWREERELRRLGGSPVKGSDVPLCSIEPVISVFDSYLRATQRFSSYFELGVQALRGGGRDEGGAGSGGTTASPPSRISLVDSRGDPAGHPRKGTLLRRRSWRSGRRRDARSADVSEIVSELSRPYFTGIMKEQPRFLHDSHCGSG
jgi:hypothetical protein